MFAPRACPEASSSAVSVTLSHSPACLKATFITQTNSKIPAVRRGKEKKKKTKPRNQQYSLSQGGPPLLGPLSKGSQGKLAV